MDAANILGLALNSKTDAPALGAVSAGGQDFLQELQAVYQTLLSGETEAKEEKISASEPTISPEEVEALLEKANTMKQIMSGKLPETVSDSETVLKYMMGQIAADTEIGDGETMPLSKDFLSIFEDAAEGTSESETVTELDIADIPTAEKYMKDLEEKLALVKELLKKLRQNEGGEEEGNTHEAITSLSSDEAQNAGVNTIFDKNNQGFMAVMPGKENPSAMAAEIYAQTDKANTEAAKAAVAAAAKQTADTTQADEADIDIDVDQYVKGEKAATTPEKVATAPEKASAPIVKENSTTASESTVSARKLPVEEVRMEGGNAGKGSSFNQSGEFAKGTGSEKSTFPLNSKEETTEDLFNLKSELASESKPENARNTQTEKVLRWDSVKDVEKLAKMVQQAGNNGQTKLTVRLNPENLGRLEVQLTEINGRLEVKLTASSMEGRNMLINNADAIRQQLAERGIHIDSMDLAFHDSNEREGSQYESRKNRLGNGNYSGKEQMTEDGVDEEAEKQGQGLYA